MGRRGRKPLETICWDCRNAVPNFEKLQGCSWSIFGQPVDGWVAKPTIIKSGFYRDVQIPNVSSYRVMECPLFDRDNYEYKEERK